MGIILKKNILAIVLENTALVLNYPIFCAKIGPLQLGIVLVFIYCSLLFYLSVVFASVQLVCVDEVYTLLYDAPYESLLSIDTMCKSSISDVDKDSVQPVDVSQVSQDGLSHILEVDVEPARIKELRDDVLLSCLPKESRLRNDKSAFTTAILK